MKKILIGLVGLVLAWMAQAGDDIDAVAAAMAANPAPAPAAPVRLKAVKAMSLQAAGADSGFKDYVYDATGELDIIKGAGTISLNFAVDRHFTEIESARIVFNAYDVDYPEATEHDVVYFNGTSYIRLQGGNNTWHQNAFSVSPEKIRLPETTGQIANNSFYVTVDIGNEGWVTSIGWARLEIRGKEGIVLEASDGDDPECVKVEWEGASVGDTYTVYRDGEVIASGVSGTTYEDRDVEWGKPYTYHVEGRTGGQSNDDEGLVGLLPMVTDVEVAELWLTKEGPYNVRLTWNDFDPEKVRVNNVKFTIEREQSPSFGFDYEINARTAMSSELVPRDFDLAKDGKFVAQEMHGKYTVRVTWDAYVVKSGKVVTDQDTNYNGDPMKVENVEARVFFNKYDRDSDGISNWYRYWIDDGAVVADNVAMDREDVHDGYFHFSDDAKLCGSCHPEPLNRHAYPAPSGCPQIIYPNPADGEVALRYRVSDGAAAFSAPVVAGRYGSVGADGIGIHCLALTISHERKHGELDRLRYNPTKYTIGNSQRQFSSYQTLRVLHQFLVDAKCNVEVSPYYRYYKSVEDCLYGRASMFCDLDGDGLDDYTEGSMGFSYDTPNTYEWNSTDYASYADNEILAREAEKSPIETHPENDWAFPGENCESSRTFIGNSKDTWESRRESVASRLQRINGGASALAQSVKSQSFSSKSSLMAAGSIACSRTESVSAFPDFTSETNGDLFQFKSAVLEPVVSGGGKYAALNVRIPVTYSGADDKSFLFTGYLTDDSGSPAVRVSEQRALAPGENEVMLVVDGQRLYASGLSGYSLRYVTVVGANDEFETIVGLGENLGTTTRVISADEFVAPEAMLVSADFLGRDSAGQLLVDCTVRLSGGENYMLAASLKTKDGKHVAAASKGGISGSGNVKVRLSFAARDIYLSGYDGPYVIGAARLSKGGKQIADKSMFGESEAYSYSDFASGASVLESDVGKLKCIIESSGKEDLADALRFSLPVINRSSVAMSATMSMWLRNTNGVFVAKTSKQVRVEPGDNLLTAVFSGNEINRKGVDGSYVLHEVRIIPDGENYRLFRVFPKMEPIDLNPEDFGAYPFDLRGDPVVWTGSGSGAYSVTVPLNIYRKNTVTVSALMVDADGKYVATAKKSVEYNGTGWADITVEFSEDDIQRSGRRGPYTIRYLQVASDLEGVLPLRVTSFKSQEIVRQYKLYVDASRPDDSGDGLTQATAKKTIQAAVDKAKSGDTVVVLGGKYAPFDTDNKSIEVLGLFGSERTIVDGGGTFRCATLGHEEQQTNTVLRGFTLRNGNSTGDELVLWNCGGGVCGGTVQNCVIENCTASKGGGAYYGRLENCLILDNVAETYGGGSYYGTRVNCTIVGNKAYYGGGGTYEGVSYNTIVCGNARGSSGSTADNWANGSFSHCVTDPQPSGYNGNFDPCFADPEAGDYSLLLQSPCVDVGLDDVVRTETDLAGNVRRAGTHVDIGAFEFPQNPHTMGKADFVCSKLESEEGKTLSIAVWGGTQEAASSVTIYLASALGSAADLDLTKLKIDGQSVKNAKFPLKLSWDAGSVGARVVTVPVKADKSIEGDEAIVLMLGGATGMSVGSYDTCRISLKDLTVPGVSLATAANAVGIKVSTSGSGKWHAAVGESYYTSDKARGVYHLVTPKLAQGKTSKLSLGGIKGKGEMVVLFRFTGDASERTSSTLKIYAGKQLMRTYYHSSVGSKWQQYTITDPNKGSHAYSYVFTQGSDPNAAVEISSAIWLPSGSDKPFTVYVTTLDANDGYVTGMGFYRKGQTAKISAKSKPGRKFDAWYKWSAAEGRYVRWKTSASLSFKVEEKTDVTAVFVRNPLVTVLPSPAEGGTVSGGGYCAPNKTLTLKAKPARGYVFVGWYLNGVCVSQKTSLSVRPSSGDVTYQGVFVTAADDKASLAFVTDPTASAHMETNLVPYVGVRFDMPLAWTSWSKTSVSAKNLPKGLKVSGDRITGVPTAAGVKVSTLTLKNTSTSKSLKVVFDVQPLAGWAKGSYYGYVSDATGATNGLATLTVSSVGKLSGKFAEHGTNWTIAAASYDAVYPDSPAYFAAATASYTYSAKVKSGNKTKTVKTTLKRPFQVYIGANALGYGVASAFETDGYTWFDAWQNVWGGAYKAIGKELFYTSKKKAYKTFAFVGGDGEDGFRYGLGEGQSLSVKVTTAGQVTATGAFPHLVVKKDKKGRPYEATDVYKPTCTTVLLPTTSAAEGSDGFSGVAFIYFAPSDKNGFAGYSACVEIPRGI